MTKGMTVLLVNLRLKASSSIQTSIPAHTKKKAEVRNKILKILITPREMILFLIPVQFTN